MAKIISAERVVEYSPEFKVKVVELTHRLDSSSRDIANALGLHPVMVYRWRQEYREGSLTDQPTRRVAMTKKIAERQQTDDENKELRRLRKKNAALQKENDFLKKWERYLKAQKQKGSRS